MVIQGFLLFNTVYMQKIIGNSAGYGLGLIAVYILIYYSVAIDRARHKAVLGQHYRAIAHSRYKIIMPIELCAIPCRILIIDIGLNSSVEDEFCGIV